MCVQENEKKIALKKVLFIGSSHHQVTFTLKVCVCFIFFLCVGSHERHAMFCDVCVVEFKENHCALREEKLCTVHR